MIRVVLAVMLLVIPLAAGEVFAAGNTVPRTSLHNDERSLVKTVDLRPAECGGTYSAFYSGGTNTGTSANDLMLGTAAGDTIRGQGGNDCLVGGGGLDTINGGSGTDVCIVGAATLALSISGCETVVRRG